MPRRRKKPSGSKLEPSTARLPAIRCTVAEKVKLEVKADDAGLSLSDFVRNRLFTARVAPRPTAVDAGMITELNRLSLEQSRLGNNLNQIALSLHRGRSPNHDAIQGLIAQLAGSQSLVQEALLKVVDAYDS